MKVGKNPRGIVINSADTRAYVLNYVSRDISVMNLAGTDQLMDTKLSANLPAAETLDDKIQVGKELYNTSVGEFDPAVVGGPAITGRMSRAGWGACATCHPNGLSDDVVWIFPSGPKRTIPQHTDFDPSDPTRNTMRPLNFSAERDEEEDFELNIRAVSGGTGMIVLADGVTQDGGVVNLSPGASGGRNQLKVRGVTAGMPSSRTSGWIRHRFPRVKTAGCDCRQGALFTAANCQQCHGALSGPPPESGLRRRRAQRTSTP